MNATHKTPSFMKKNEGLIFPTSLGGYFCKPPSHKPISVVDTLFVLYQKKICLCNSQALTDSKTTADVTVASPPRTLTFSLGPSNFEMESISRIFRLKKNTNPVDGS